MITITLNNITNLNNSLQVGDLIYKTSLTTQDNAIDAQSADANVGGGAATNIVGILRRITVQGTNIVLDVDETQFIATNVPQPGDFIMFSKYDQIRGDVIGYYAKAKFKNNSKKAAEMFSVGSEVVINSK